ncbi:MAG: hypothetical protein ACKPCI_12780 [Dolichospermum sp.]
MKPNTPTTPPTQPTNNCASLQRRAIALSRRWEYQILVVLERPAGW